MLKKFQQENYVEEIFEDLFYYIECQPNENIHLKEYKDGNFKSLEIARDFVNECFLNEIDLFHSDGRISYRIRYFIIQKLKISHFLAISLLELFYFEKYSNEEFLNTLTLMDQNYIKTVTIVFIRALLKSWILI